MRCLNARLYQYQRNTKGEIISFNTEIIILFGVPILYSNAPCLHVYSQWLNLVIYWLINHCMDWARAGVKSFSRQFDFLDVIYQIQHCNVDDRLRKVIFTTK